MSLGFNERRKSANNALSEAYYYIEELLSASSEIEKCLKTIYEFDISLFFHSFNVGILAVTYCFFEKKSKKETDNIAAGSLLHDIGKLYVPKEILMKPGKLTAEEFSLIKAHPLNGYNYLKNSNIPDRSRKIVLQHHENWDGSGYPCHLKEKRIDELACIVHICDVYDALISKRAYKNRLSMDESVSILLNDCGKGFSPEHLEIFLQMLSVMGNDSIDLYKRIYYRKKLLNHCRKI